MQAQGYFVTLREGAGAKAVIAPELGGWLLRYARHFPGVGYVEGLHFSQEVVDRYPNQMYAGNPLLFPMVSFNHAGERQHHYEWRGGSYPLPQHGFARRSRWKVVEVRENAVRMELRSSPETRSVYPFEFRTSVSYALENGRLRFRQVVENAGGETMPFSTGIHPYLPVPVTPEGKRSHCYVELPAAQRVLPDASWNIWMVQPSEAQKLSVSEDVSGTLFLTGLEKPEVSLVDPGAGFRIRLNFAEAPRHRFLALWSKSPGEPYYCIEPWTALPNSFARGTELIQLAPRERFEASIWLEIERL
jgi:galactose mutarotase-like enzyme